MERLGLRGNLLAFISKNQTRKKRIITKILLTVLILLLLFEFVTMLIEPTLIALCQVKATSIGVTVSSTAVSKVMSGIGYQDLITLDRDESGKIIALRANVIEMNSMSSKISIEIQKICNELEETSVKIPLGNFTGNSLLSGRGPRVTVKFIPLGTAGTDFKTEFISTGINQTRHRIYIEVICSISVVAPFASQTMRVINNVNVAETVLIGDVPSTFYNLEGVSEYKPGDTTALWEQK